MSQYRKWDYREPYYYMVTLKRLPNLPPLSILDENDKWGFKRDYPLTVILQETLHKFWDNTPSVESIVPYAIMPDHIHVLIKIADIPNRKSLNDLVDLMMRLLRNAFQKYVGRQIPLFEKEWHDLIVKKRGQLKHFHEYILNNPKMALLRQQHRDLFHCYRDYNHWRLGEQTCDLVGNPELLDEPAFLAVRLSRSLKPNTPEWQKVEAFYSQWRPGATAVGTWWSPAEKMAYRHVIENGGNVIFLSPDGFDNRWHPTGEEGQRLCAEGRLLFLSPYAPHTAKLPLGETRARCLALNDLAKRMAEADATTRPVARLPVK